MTQHQIVAEHILSEPPLLTLEKSLLAYNLQTTGLVEYHNVLFCVRDEAHKFCGGVSGYVWGGWLHITMLWLDETVRGRGLGRELLETAEQHARELGCDDVFLNTFDFQAPAFYQKHGYQVFGQLADCPHGYTSFYLRKHLPQRAEPASADGNAPLTER
jgi:ribosomal protein S18 acetylase RimI-like enzyme